MKQSTKFFLTIPLYVVVLQSYHQLPPPKIEAVPYYSIRPQGVDAARELVGWTRAINQYDAGCVYGSVSLTAEYARSFNGIAIANSLMSSNLTYNNGCGIGTFRVVGSQISSRTAQDLLADNFYLPTDFGSILTIEPLIENVVADIDFYIGLDRLLNGLFFRMNAPINFSRWALRITENPAQEILGVNGYDPGYFNAAGISRSGLLTSFLSYLGGDVPFAATGVTFNPLCYARVEGCSGNESKTCLAELEAILGWNFIDRERGHLGVGLLTRAPTGNRPTGRLWFEPISGNGGHWELGAHITSHYTFWQCDGNSVGFYIDANITHLFNATQTRTFDLVDKPLSRYMLAQQLGSPVVNLTGSSSIDGPGTDIPNAQFQNVFSPVANLTTRTLKVSAAVQADIAAQFTYSAGDGFTFDVGYNFWVRSCDKFNLDDCLIGSSCIASCPSSGSCSSSSCAVDFAPSTWALKGDAYVIGFDISSFPQIPVALSATESQATIYGGTNFPVTGAAKLPDGSHNLIPAQSNSGIDNREYAFTSIGNPLYGTLFGVPGTEIGTSIEPVFIQESDINFAGTRGLSNKVYAHMSYTWLECACGKPFIGVGGFGEFGINANDCGNDQTTSCITSCCSAWDCKNSSCNTVALSQWGVWFKAGVSF